MRAKRQRIGRNPRTGVEAIITPGRVLTFKPSAREAIGIVEIGGEHGVHPFSISSKALRNAIDFSNTSMKRPARKPNAA